MEKFHLQVITPDKVVFDDKVQEAMIPTVEGEIGVLAHHVPLISILKPGELKIVQEGEIHYVATGGGCIEVNKQEVRILADSAERADDIDETRATDARERAEKLIKEAADDVSFADATAYLEKNLIRLKVAQRKKKHHSRGSL